MKRALAILAAVAFLALLVAAFLLAGPRGNPGPVLALRTMTAAELAQVTPDLELAQGGGDRQHVVFGRRTTGSGVPDFVASIVVVRDSGPMDVPLDAAVFGGLMFVHAARSGDGRLVWALADNAVESPGWQLELVRSTDGGLTWRHLATIPKPSYMAQLESFRMSGSGQGAVTVSLSTDAPATDESGFFGWLRSMLPQGGDAGAGDMLPHGLYVYRTSDGGLTWSGPVHYEDDTEDAWRADSPIPGFAEPPGSD